VFTGPVCLLRQDDVAGCGQHVDAVMARVAPPDRCQCEQPTHQGLFTRLFRRR